MARFVRGEQSEISMDYINVPDAPARRSQEDGGVMAAAPGETETNSLTFNHKTAWI